MLVLENLDEFGRGKALQRGDEGLPETADVLVNAVGSEEAFVDQAASMRRGTLVNTFLHDNINIVTVPIERYYSPGHLQPLSAAAFLIFFAAPAGAGSVPADLAGNTRRLPPCLSRCFFIQPAQEIVPLFQSSVDIGIRLFQFNDEFIRGRLILFRRFIDPVSIRFIIIDDARESFINSVVGSGRIGQWNKADIGVIAIAFRINAELTIDQPFPVFHKKLKIRFKRKNSRIRHHLGRIGQNIGGKLDFQFVEIGGAQLLPLHLDEVGI